MRKSSPRHVRVRIAPPLAPFECGIDSMKPNNNKPPKDWDTGYELVVRFRYGLDEEAIAKIAGLRNYDTGISLCGEDAGIRDLMFPCGESQNVAMIAANRLHHADHFGALTLEITCPVEKIGKVGFANTLDFNGRIIRRAKLLPRPFVIIRRAKRPSRRVTSKTTETRLCFAYFVDPKTGKRLPAEKKRRGRRWPISRNPKKKAK